ncbi:hypothetical protein [Guptibacillus hwajinpoensis]|uniref:DUF4259 domain-containing protein n=1 Tax=Guptibacillus hwajinpoensis TaxID=208199 RepID=A0ABU0K148_9BACL|nr:hypothetical protein [Alkalihalobacillus hemicentroti]MDQ0483082.1 hypothetical protein [Alkalihalobacillus hemicentroti]
MGAWGVAILSDDIAEDISLRYKDLLGDNYSSEEASKVVIDEFDSELDEEEITTFWLSFALIQWKLGRLQDEVKVKALQVIDSGDDLIRWDEDPKLKQKRETVLLKLKEQLNSTQPEAKKVRKRFISETFLEAGDAISYRLLSESYIILKVIGILEEWNGNRYPLFEICEWQGTVIPSKEKISQLPLKELTWENGEKELTKLAIFPAGKRDDPIKRIELVAEDVKTILDMEAPYMTSTWREFDDQLKQFYYFK